MFQAHVCDMRMGLVATVHFRFGEPAVKPMFVIVPNVDPGIGPVNVLPKVFQRNVRKKSSALHSYVRMEDPVLYSRILQSAGR